MSPTPVTNKPNDEQRPQSRTQRLRRILLALGSAVMAVVVTVTLIETLPALPGWFTDDSVPESQEMPDPVTGSTGEIAPREPGDELAEAADSVPEASWPDAARETVPVSETADPEAMTPVGGLPVQAVSTEGGSAEVEVLDRAAARDAGVDGLLLRVEADDEIELHVDHTDFAAAYGGSYGDRLTLTRVPDCFVDTPERDECRTPLDTEPATGTATTVGAVFDPAQGTPEPADEARAPLAPGTLPTEPVGSSTGVFALVASASGSSGNYSATPLEPSSEWSVSASSGVFSWSYPLEPVPVPSSFMPHLALDYSSQTVDGRTSATNNQGSWIGEGFSYEPGYIERSYKACADDGHEYKGDQCWGTENATLMLNGTSGSLIKDDDSGEWRLKGDDGSQVEHLTGADNGDDDGEYWRVTTTDGTRYYFGRHRLPGWSSGDETTDSTWTVPVFGDDDGEPCHDDSFSDSWCQQAWRWNLDYVEDPRGNVMTYFYEKEINHYALDADTDTEGTPYTRGGYLQRVDYGQTKDEIYQDEAPARVVFDTAERCLPDDDFDCDPDELDEDTAKHWPDVPYDRFCEEGDECAFSQTAPSFWTRKRLEEVRTQHHTGDEYQTVDSWELTHLFTDNGDGSRTLWLSEITRTGHDGDESESLPPVQLDGIQLPNRVDVPDDDIQPLVRFRLAVVYTETGGQIDINYSGGDCDPEDLPEEGEQTGRCYPVKWNPPGEEDPITDWFHKYVVEEVIETDRTGGSPDQVTQYEYVGDAGWRHAEPDGITDEKYQTWGQWRGYETVRVRTGDGQDMPTRTDHTFLRGLHDGEDPDGGTVSVKVSDSTGEKYTDHDELAGHQLEEITYDGDEIVDKTISEPWRHVTATRKEDWGTTRAAFTNTGVERTLTALADDEWRKTEATTTFDTDTGRSERVEDLGDLSTDADDMCTRTTYADNEDAHIRVHIARVESVSVACSEEAGPGDVVSDVRRHYDGGAYGDEPTHGDVTLTEGFEGRDDNGDPVYATVREVDHDEYGQQVEVTDAEGVVSESIEYSYDNGLITGFTVTNALDHMVENHVDPARGIVYAEIDANGRRTDTTYDPLGRLTEVWLPDRPKDRDMSPNTKFGYSITENAPAAVSTSTILNDGSYETSYEIYDGFLRPRQTQMPGPDGGRLVSDTFHNGIGQVAKTNDTYYALGEPGDDLLVVRNGDVQGQTVYAYDGAERLTDVIQRVAGDEVWRTTAVHEGDRVHVTPAEGGVPTTVINDARGQKVEQRQYTGDTPEGEHVSTTYTYGPRGEIVSMTTPSGEEWSYEYDHRGRQVAVAAPDTGTTTSVYDDLDQLVSTTDANGTTVSYVYDELGRRVESWEGRPGEGDQLTGYQYDTALKGQLFIQTRHTPEGEFRIGVVGQDELDRPTNILYGIPESQGALAGDYEFSISYNIDGTVQGMGLPAAGGLPAESTVIGYDELGRPTTLSGTDSYVTRTEYNQLGQVLQTELNAGSGPTAWITNEYEKGTQRLLGTRVDRQGGSATLMDTGYTYDDAGNVRAITDAPEGGAAETQCFTYDPLLQLTEAWTLPHEDPGECEEEATPASVGGPASYWHSYEYDDAGNRVGETLHDVTGSGDDAVRDYTYPDQGQGQPNTVREVVEQTPQGDTLSVFDYDDAGNTVVRELAGERQELEWTPEGKLASVTTDEGETSFTYTAGGERLVYSTPFEDVLYLPGMELRSNKFTGELRGVRYYEHAGQTVAVRSPERVDLLASDHHGSGQVAMDAHSEHSVRRYLTPFGEERGGSSGFWPDDKGFLGKPVDVFTGLTLVGAREYDATLGRFISADPIIDDSDPLQLNGYAYANNSPLTYADPTGLFLSSAWNSIKSGASKVGKAVKSGYNSTKKWVKKNKSTIVSVGVGIAVGAGCTALTAGAGAIGCAALGGAIGGLVQYGMDTPRNNWSWGGAATSTVIGGALGAAGGAIGGRIAGAIGSRVSSWTANLGSRSGAVRPRIPQPPPPPKPPRPTPTSTTPRPAPTMSSPTTAGRGACNSFVPGTGVVMADGTTKAIEDIRVGDQVLATDPETGEQGVRTVAATINGEGDKTLVRITVDPTTEREAPEEGESAGSDSASEVPGPVVVGDVVVATDGHPFWVPELDAWVEAIDLAPGMWLQTSSGTWVQVSAVEVDARSAQVHNLTVAGLHTYHVVVGDLDLLNHNCQANGGRYGHLKPAGPGNEINHMPQHSSTPISHYSGPAVRMARADHREVYSTGSSVESQAWLSMQKGLVNSGRIDRAMMNDINDVVTRFPGVYNNSIGEMIGSLPRNPAYQRLRTVPSQVYVQLTLW